MLLLLLLLLLLQAGFGEFQVTQWNGRRADAFATHLKPAMGRPNLEVRRALLLLLLQIRHDSDAANAADVGAQPRAGSVLCRGLQQSQPCRWGCIAAI